MSGEPPIKLIANMLIPLILAKFCFSDRILYASSLPATEYG